MINLALAFLIELIALASFGYLGIMLFSDPFLQIIAAAVGIVVMGTLWAIFFSPKANHRLFMPWIFIGKLILLLMPAYIMLYRKEFAWAAAWTVLVTAHLIISAVQKQI